MTTKEYLQQIRKYDKIIKNRIRELDNLRIAVQNISSFRLSKDVVVTSKRKDKMESLIVRMVDEEKYINDFIDRKYSIISKMEKLDIKDYDILYLRFVDGKKFEEILDILNDESECSERQMYRRYKKAMKAFEEQFGDNYL